MASWCHLLLHIINHHHSTAGRWAPDDFAFKHPTSKHTRGWLGRRICGRTCSSIWGPQICRCFHIPWHPLCGFDDSAGSLEEIFRKPAMLWINLSLPTSSYIASSNFHATCLCKYLVLLGRCLFVAEHFEFVGFVWDWGRESALCGKSWQD